MTAQSNMTEALELLNDKLDVLQVMTEVNSFLVAQMQENKEVLQQMSAQEARNMLRRKARAKYRADGGSQPNAKALALVEKTLGNAVSAQIIPFPTRS